MITEILKIIADLLDILVFEPNWEDYGIRIYHVTIDNQHVIKIYPGFHDDLRYESIVKRMGDSSFIFNYDKNHLRDAFIIYKFFYKLTGVCKKVNKMKAFL